MNKYDEAKTLVYDALFVLCDCNETIYEEAVSLPGVPRSDVERMLLNAASRLATISDRYNRDCSKRKEQ